MAVGARPPGLDVLYPLSPLWLPDPHFPRVLLLWSCGVELGQRETLGPPSHTHPSLELRGGDGAEPGGGLCVIADPAEVPGGVAAAPRAAGGLMGCFVSLSHQSGVRNAEGWQ